MPYYDQSFPNDSYRTVNINGSIVSHQPIFIPGNGFINDYVKYALAKYDQLSYDLDSMLDPGRFWCNSRFAGGCEFSSCAHPYCPYSPSGSQSSGSASRFANFINSVSDPAQSIDGRSPVPFAANRVIQGRCIRHADGASSFILGCPGTYLISYNANITPCGDTPATISLSLFAGDAPVPGSRSSVTITKPGRLASVSASALITVSDENSHFISLVNLSTARIQIRNAGIVIIRLG